MSRAHVQNDEEPDLDRALQDLQGEGVEGTLSSTAPNGDLRVILTIHVLRGATDTTVSTSTMELGFFL